MKTIKNGIVDKLGKSYSPNLDEITDKPYQKPTHAELAERLAKGLGKCWHERNRGIIGQGFVCTCGFKTWDDMTFGFHCHNHNPTYLHAGEILEAMRQGLSEDKFELFMAQLEFGYLPEVEAIDWSHHIDVDFIFNVYSLLEKAVEFMEGK